MRMLRLLLVVGLSCGALLALAPSAGAVSSNCKSLTGLQTKLSNIDTSSKKFKQSNFSDIGDAFHSAASKAKSKLKSALNTLGGIYDTIGGGDISAMQDLGSTKYENAYKTFTKSLITCS